MSPEELIFWTNVNWNVDQVAAQLEQAKMVKGRARSGYYKVAYLLGASIAEALSHYILKEKMASLTEEQIPLEDWKCCESHVLPNSHQGVADYRMSVCKRKRSRFALRRRTDWGQINEVCREIGVFRTQFFNRIQRLRENRNKIHIQGLEDIERSWNMGDINYMTRIVIDLYDIVG